MRNLSFSGMAKNTFPKCVVVVVCLFLFVFFFLPPSFCNNFIVSTFISALGSDDNHHNNRVVYIMTSQSKSLIILLGWPGLPSFLSDTTCMKRASSKSQCAHERYVDRCPVVMGWPFLVWMLNNLRNFQPY